MQFARQWCKFIPHHLDLPPTPVRWCLLLDNGEKGKRKKNLLMSIWTKWRIQVVFIPSTLLDGTFSTFSPILQKLAKQFNSGIPVVLHQFVSSHIWYDDFPLNAFMVAVGNHPSKELITAFYSFKSGCLLKGTISLNRQWKSEWGWLQE